MLGHERHGLVAEHRNRLSPPIRDKPGFIRHVVECNADAGYQQQPAFRAGAHLRQPEVLPSDEAVTPMRGQEELYCGTAATRLLEVSCGNLENPNLDFPRVAFVSPFVRNEPKANAGEIQVRIFKVSTT